MSLAFVAPAAQADILFFGGGGPIQPEENVLLTTDVTGTTITGTTNQTGATVLFTQPVSPVQLVAPSSGASRIAAATGNFTSLRTQLANGASFTLFEANPILTTGGIRFNVNVIEADGSSTFNPFEFTSGMGSSFFGIQAINGQRISFVDIIAPTGTLVDVRQIRIGGVAGPGINPVPEPSEWLAMGMAAASVGGLMVRARRRKSLAA